MVPFMSGAAVSVAGLYTAAFDLQVEWLVVKGIAGYADGRETTNEKWSEFASANAPSLVAKILTLFRLGGGGAFRTPPPAKS